MADPRLLEAARQIEACVHTLQGRTAPAARQTDPVVSVLTKVAAEIGARAAQSGEAEAAAAEHAARLHALVTAAIDAIITIDEQGIIESVNPATEEMFQFPADELVGHNCTRLMPPPYCDEHSQYIRRYLDTGKPHIIGIGREAVGRKKDGTVFPIDLAVSELTVGGRRLFLGIVRDITDRKELERQVLEIGTAERQRIGRDLHDGLGQQLTGIAFLTGVLQKGLASASHPRAADADEIVHLVNHAIDQTRALVRGLCPVNLDDDGLMMALQRLADSTAELHRIRCRFVCQKPVLIDDHHAATHLYYIANEAVNNALRHGRPREIQILLRRLGRRVTLAVVDNGAGFDASGDHAAGWGLQIMHHRARMIGGTLDFESRPGQGTRVTCGFDPATRAAHDAAAANGRVARSRPQAAQASPPAAPSA